jgi:hypothetical protein
MYLLDERRSPRRPGRRRAALPLLAAVLVLGAGAAPAALAQAPEPARQTLTVASDRTILPVSQAQPSDTGRPDEGDPSMWRGVLAFLGWILLALVVAGFLVWTVLGRRGGGARSGPAEPRDPPPGTAVAEAAALPARDGPPARDLTVLTFDRADGAERAFGDVRGRAGDAPWIRDVAFVECRHHGRIAVRGTFAGHYLDEEDVGRAARDGTVAGTVAETVVALAFGPPEVAARLAAGDAHADGGTRLEAIRAALPERSSGIVSLAPPPHADAMIAAFADRPARVTRHRLSAVDAAALEATAAAAPPAAPPAA